jgi:uncharacterized lipoprotein NlpE involved in copper resistance
MKPQLLLFACLALVGCSSASNPAATALTPEQVLSWAKLDQSLASPRDLVVAQADGRAGLGDYVTLMNGEEAKRFLRQHGYAQALRTVAVRRTESTIEVDVEIAGRDGQKTILTLYADGQKQGIG